MRKAVEGVAEALTLQKVFEVREEGNISKREVVASHELGFLQMVVQSGEVFVEVLLEFRGLGGIARGAVHHGLEEVFADDGLSGMVVGLMNRKPLFDLASRFEICGVQCFRLLLARDITRNGT